MDNRRFHNNGPIGERDYEDAGDVYPAAKVVPGPKALTLEQLKMRRQKEDVIIARMVATYTKSKGFAPNAIMMTNIRRDAALEARS